MVSPFLLAVVVTILPAMAALWWLLKRYEGYFQDGRVFFSLVVGFFVGLAATAMEATVFQFHSAWWVQEIGAFRAFVLFVVGYAFFETGAKGIVLGTGRFRQRKDTPYYGAALGLGFGAMAALFYATVGLRMAAEWGGDLGRGELAFVYAIMILVPLGTVFTHGATGVWIGLGSANGVLWRGWVLGTLLQAPALMALWLLVAPPNAMGLGMTRFVLAAVVSVGYGLGLLHITRKRILDTIVPPEIREQVRRDLRRARRRAALGLEPLPLGVAAGAATMAASDEEEGDLAVEEAAAGDPARAGATPHAAEDE